MSTACYAQCDGRLRTLEPQALEAAMWIDFHNPGRADRERMGELGIDLPRPEELESIEPSARLYRGDTGDVITVNLSEPGERGETFGPVSFILHGAQLITVRYHSPQLWYGLALTDIGSKGDLLAALLTLSVGHIADALEARDRRLDRLTNQVFAQSAKTSPARLRRLIRESGRMGEELSEIRLNLLILRRALVHLDQLRSESRISFSGKAAMRNLDRDVEALTVHADYLGGRVTLAIDATVGLISLAQNDTARIYSVVAVLFLPATLIASVFGMNFADMPMLGSDWGFDIALLLMLVAAAAIFVLFLIRRWL